MKGILNKEFHLIEVDSIDNYIDGIHDDVDSFYMGEEVEIVKEIITEDFMSGKAYIILTRRFSAMIIDSSFVDLLVH